MTCPWTSSSHPRGWVGEGCFDLCGTHVPCATLDVCVGASVPAAEDGLLPPLPVAPSTQRQLCALALRDLLVAVPRLTREPSSSPPRPGHPHQHAPAPPWWHPVAQAVAAEAVTDTRAAPAQGKWSPPLGCCSPSWQLMSSSFDTLTPDCRCGAGTRPARGQHATQAPIYACSHHPAYPECAVACRSTSKRRQGRSCQPVGVLRMQQLALALAHGRSRRFLRPGLTAFMHCQNGMAAERVGRHPITQQQPYLTSSPPPHMQARMSSCRHLRCATSGAAAVGAEVAAGLRAAAAARAVRAGIQGSNGAAAAAGASSSCPSRCSSGRRDFIRL